MGNGDTMEIVERVRVLRVAVLPPYVFDEDDDCTRLLTEYLEFYKGLNPVAVLGTIKRYIEAWRNYQRSGGSAIKFEKLLEARKHFTATVPFVHDEVAMPDEATLLYLGEVYQRVQPAELWEAHDEYLRLVEALVRR